MVKDLTVGKPSKVLWQFSIPMFISVIFQQLYNITDSVVAGKFAGEEALAAVGASYPVTMIFMAVAVGSNIGCSVIISQLFGAKRYKEMKTAIYTTLISSVVLSLVLMAAGLAFCGPMMNLIQTPVNIFEDASLYLKIYIGGFLFLFLYNVCTGIFNSLGDSKTPLYFLIGSSLGNIILDMVFVIVFHWGVAGVAWATFLAQGIACILAAVTVRKRIAGVETQGAFPAFSWEMLKKVGMVAVPSILQQSFISIGNMFIQGLVNSLGSPVIAGYSAAVKLNTFTITSFTTLANGLSSFTAQNMGAGEEGRVKSGFRAGWSMAIFVAIPFTLVFFFMGAPVIRIFMEQPGGEAMNTGISFLRIVSPFYIVVATKLMADGVLRGSGAMRYFMITTFADLILRVVISFLLAGPFGANGIWMSWPIGWCIAACLSMGFYLRGSWKYSEK
ncbi:MATE family efflux transporter [Clostridium sp. Marseille-P2415]|uniref:MATE family efflux transporter n=1 Tax=Clostridium sp. Marseille-P2415 TaxID=1805471 RepID=UPI0009887D47|nr:MATE family efflux transporter [Clostridium sp. Marseille-P2415]